MPALTEEIIERLQNVVESPRNPREQFLSDLLNNIPSDEFNEVVNQRLPEVTTDQVRTFGMENFHILDRHPNPPDGVVSIDEIAESLVKDENREHMAMLLFIWLHFDEIRQSSDDFSGEEKLFDNVLTAKDFENYKPL